MNKALLLYSQKGYHNVTMDEIAEESGLSTGIAYRYFKNKKDLLLNSLEYAFENINSLTDTSEDTLSRFNNTEETLSYALEQFEALHRKYYDFHEELEGLRHSDSDVKNLYDKIENKAIQALYEKLPEHIRNSQNSKEKMYLAVGLMEHYCHMVMDDKYSGLDFAHMKSFTIKMTVDIFDSGNYDQLTYSEHF